MGSRLLTNADLRQYCEYQSEDTKEKPRVSVTGVPYISAGYHIIDNIAYKISKAIGIIARLRHFVPLSTLNSIYRCLIQPYTTYGIVVWGNTSKKCLDKILKGHWQ